jgi:hypothetical protein
MAVFQGKNLTSSNLVLHLDATNSKSYSGSGNTWYDLSGYGNNGILNNGVLFNSYGGFFELDGSNDYIEIPHSISLNIGTGTSATIEIVYDVYNFSTASSLIAKRSSDVSTATDYMIFNSTDLLWLTGDSSGTGNSLPTSSFQENRNIQTVSATINSTTTNKKIYKDGNQVISATYASKTASNSASVFLGKYFGSGFYFNGRIYSVKIYNKELTDTEIAKNFQANKIKYTYNLPIVRDGLLIHYDATSPLSYAGVGTIWYDISGNNYHSILYNGPVFTGSGSTGYFYFDGTNDYGETISSINETVTEATFSTWVYYDGTPDTYDAIIFDRGSATGLNTHDSNYVSTHWNNDGGEAFNSGIIPSANKWNYMVGTVSPTESRYYLNNVRGNTQVRSRSSHTFGQLQLARDSAALGRYTKGRISQILLYDRELSPNEVMQNYRALKGRYHNFPQENLSLSLEFYNKDSYPGTGTSIVDNSGNMLVATSSNGPVFSPLYGGIFTLDGVDDTIVTSSLNLSSTNKITVCFWAKLSNYTEVVSSGKLLIENSSNYNNTTTGWVISCAEDSSASFLSSFPIVLAVKGDVNYNFACYSKTLVNDLKWHFWTCVFDKSQASSEVAFYLDGLLRTPTITSIANNTNNFGNNPVYISNRVPSAFSISDLHIYNGVLSSQDVKNMYDSTRSRFGK